MNSCDSFLGCRHDRPTQLGGHHLSGTADTGSITHWRFVVCALQAAGLVTVAAATTLWKDVVCALQVAGFVNVQLLAGAVRHQHKVHGDGGLLAQARCTTCLSQVRIRLPAMPTSWGAPVRSVRWLFHIRFFTQLTCTCALAYRCTDGWSAAAAQLLEVFAGCWTPDAVSFGRLGHSCWLLTTFLFQSGPSVCAARCPMDQTSRRQQTGLVADIVSLRCRPCGNVCVLCGVGGTAVGANNRGSAGYGGHIPCSCSGGCDGLQRRVRHAYLCTGESTAADLEDGAGQRRGATDLANGGAGVGSAGGGGDGSHSGGRGPQRRRHPVRRRPRSDGQRSGPAADGAQCCKRCRRHGGRAAVGAVLEQGAHASPRGGPCPAATGGLWSVTAAEREIAAGTGNIPSGRASILQAGDPA